MEREQIIRMAREAGFGFNGASSPAIERFAALVAAAEREKVAAWMIQRSYATGHGDTTEDLLKELDWQIDERIAAEREACANVCEEECSDPYEDFKNYEDTHTDGWMDGCNSCAAAIRARSEK